MRDKSRTQISSSFSEGPLGVLETCSLFAACSYLKVTFIDVLMLWLKLGGKIDLLQYIPHDMVVYVHYILSCREADCVCVCV